MKEEFIYVLGGLSIIAILIFGLYESESKTADPRTANRSADPQTTELRLDPNEQIHKITGPTWPQINIRRGCKQRSDGDYEEYNRCVAVQKETEKEAYRLNPDDDVSRFCTKNRNGQGWKYFVECLQKQQVAKAAAQGDALNFPKVNIGQFCQRKWPTDWEMQDYCVRKQEDARDSAKSLFLNDVSIAQHCVGEWPVDWEMYKYCLTQQIASKNKL